MGWKEEKKIKPSIVKEETHGVDTFIEYYFYFLFVFRTEVIFLNLLQWNKLLFFQWDYRRPTKLLSLQADVYIKPKAQKADLSQFVCLEVILS